MGYLDSLPGGLQSVYGGSQQLYRKPQYTQIGQTRVTSPTRLPLGGSMYGDQALEMPTVGAGDPAPLAPTPTPETQATQLDVSAEDYLGETGNWEQVRLDGVDRWMPANAQEGQIYEAPNEGRWIFWNGQWVTGNISETPQTYTNSYPGQSFRQVFDSIDSKGTYEEFLYGFLVAFTRHKNDNPGSTQWDSDIDLLRNELKLQGIDPDTLDLGVADYAGIQTGLQGAGQVETDFTNWQDQITDFMGTLDTGDVTYNPDTGQFESDGVATEGWVADWMSEVVGQSYETGGVSGELFTIDDDGNIVLAEELQTMSDWFEQNPDVSQDYMEYNRQLAAHAIASGKSLNSGYYSEAAANAVSNYAAQQTDQIAKVMMEDIGSQFDYIANSIAGMMKDIWKGNEMQMFQEAMATQRAALEQEYDQWSQQMAANIAETEAARQGEIMTSIFTFIINMGLAFL